MRIIRIRITKRGNRALIGVERPSHYLEARDLILLIVLGAVQSGCVSVGQVIATAKEMAPQDWQPTNDVVGAGVKMAGKAHLLDLVPSEDLVPPVRLQISDRGRTVLRDLLRRSLPPYMGGAGRACVAAKLSFLDHLSPEERSGQLEELARAYRGALVALHQRSQAPATAYRSRRWLDHEIERFEWELAWLDRLRSTIGPRGETPDPSARICAQVPVSAP